MISILREKKLLTQVIQLTSMSLFCIGLSLFRVYKAENIRFLFLNWNLFLAAIPFALTSLMKFYPDLLKSKVVSSLIICTWILFFPNAPYILTDLFHLSENGIIPMWYDLILILAYAWTGMALGLLSLIDLEELYLYKLKPITQKILISSFIFLSCFGVYLGRFLRWNSWDVLHQPQNLFFDISDRFLNPMNHSRTWGFTILMGILLNFIYWNMKHVGSLKKVEINN